MSINISDRLKKIANYVEYDTFADIGTDHAYLPIYLCETRKMKKILACDLNEGPIDSAKANIAQHGFTDIIETRLGSGFTKVQCGEVESAVIAGMGGILMCNIISERSDVVKNLRQLVLQPQHNLPELRKFLVNNNIAIVDETVVFDMGKYYFIFECRPINDFDKSFFEYSEKDFILGKFAFLKNDGVYESFAENEIKKIRRLIATIVEQTKIANENIITNETQLKLDELESLITLYESVLFI